MSSNKLVFGLLAIAVAYLYRKYGPNDTLDEDVKETLIIQAWNTRIKEPSRQFSRVSVGINANVDLIVRGTELLRALNITAGKVSDHAVMQSIDDLQEAFSYFFAKGAAAERNFVTKEDYKKMVAAGAQLDRVDWYVGGNAALMAQKIVTSFPDTKVQLVGPIGPRLKHLLHRRIKVPKASMTEEDEVHMILEYKVGDQWGSATAPVATRFITSYDESNGKATPLPIFFDSLGEFKPDLVVISGLHMLEGQPESFWKQRLDLLTERLQQIPDTIPVHLELASMVNSRFMKYVLMKVVPHLSSLGCNEQELVFARYLGVGGRDAKVFDKVSSVGLNEQEIQFASTSDDGPPADSDEDQDGQPDIHLVSDIMLWMLKKYAYHHRRNPASKLTRIHFHSLTYHIIGTVPDAWENVPAAVAAGTRIAGRQACDTPRIQPVKMALRTPSTFKLYSGDSTRQFNPAEPVSSWEMGGFSFSFSPVLICRKPLKTVGLGDAISATGLLFSSYNSDYKH